MAVERLTGRDDPRVGAYREMSDAQLVRERGLFVAEGRLVVQRLIEDGLHRVKSVLVSDSARRQLEPVLSRLNDDVPVYVCDPDDFRGVTGYNIHRGCLALAEPREAIALAWLLESSTLLLVLEGVTNADNVGGAFRNAAAFGTDGVLLSPTCCDPLYRKAIRTSMGATLRVPFVRAQVWPEALAGLRAAGFTIVALTPRDDAEDLDRFVEMYTPPKVAVLVGTEGAGLTGTAESTADFRVRIPIRADVDSLNLGTATGIALYRIVRGRRSPAAFF
jgi:tRNA G18 (ribose-2'-O)-methylase SpoU